MNYRKLYESHFGLIPKDENGVPYEIHHIDGNHKNNDLANLQCISIQEHYNIHLSQGDYHAANLIAERIQNPTLVLRGYKKPLTEATKIKLRKPKSNTYNYKKPKSLEHANNIRLARTGISRPDVSEANRRNKKGVIPKHNLEVHTCPHCGIEANGFGYTRWHGNNCKQKEVIYG